MVHYYLDHEFSAQQSFYCFLCEETKIKSIDLISLAFSYNFFITYKNIVRYFINIHSDIIYVLFTRKIEGLMLD